MGEASPATPGVYVYVNMATKRLLTKEPTVEDAVPRGWKKVQSRSNPSDFYYLHNATGVTQKGRPCEGVPEDLPDGWEKVAASQLSSPPYYFNRITNEYSLEKPTALPNGWFYKVSNSQRKTYYWHEMTNHSQFEKPQDT